MDRIKVFVADDHELVRYALRTVLEAEGDMEVVGEAGTSEEVVTSCCSLRPDVLVLDMRMPGEGGVGVCRKVREACPDTAVLVLTSFDGDEELFGALSAGACGYLLKDTRPERIVHAIRLVSDGEAVFDNAVVDRILNDRRSNERLAEPLSEREMEVLELMAKGLSNKQISKELWIGETTVKTHVSHILRKLGQADRTQAVLEAVKLGLVRLGG
jgi:two-component system, NarL family, response regulator DevR